MARNCFEVATFDAWKKKPWLKSGYISPKVGEFLVFQSGNTAWHPPPFCTELGGGYPPLLGKNYIPPKILQFPVKIEQWARFGMGAHLC